MNESQHISDERIRQSFRWQKSDVKTAQRLKISVAEYKRRKKIIKDQDRISREAETAAYIDALEGKIIENYNLANGTGTLSGFISDRPLSPEEIEIKYNIDKTKWRLSSYWNKEQNNGKFLVSANVTQLKSAPINPVEQIERIIQSHKFIYKPVTKLHLNTNFKTKTCGVLSLQDIHVGKATLEPDNIVESVKSCIESLVLRSYHSSYLDKIIFVLGGDLVNMDTYTGTTTSGTPVENSLNAYDSYKIAFDLMFWCVNYLKQFCNTLQVVYVPGNHSRLTEAHIAYALSKCIVDPNITWDIDYAERRVSVYGDNLFCFEHGDFDIKKSFFVYATEFPKEWGNAKYRTLYTGHTHKHQKIEYKTQDELNGFVMRTLPSLCKIDMYHYSNKWTSNVRGGIIELHDENKGSTGEFRDYQ